MKTRVLRRCGGVSQRRAGATTYDHADRLGTAYAQSGAAGTVTAMRLYDAFGMPNGGSGAPQGPFGFAGAFGYQEDGDTGLKLLGHRYYDPSTGRFLTRDPIKDGGNWYAYCEDNPLAGVDADGNKLVLINATLADVIALTIALWNIAQTDHGSWAYEALYGPAVWIYKFTDDPDEGTHSNPYHPEVTIQKDDLRDLQVKTTDGKWEDVGWERLLAHEYGHYKGNLGNDVKDENEVVQKYENPVMVDLRRPRRGRYEDTRKNPRPRPVPPPMQVPPRRPLG